MIALIDFSQITDKESFHTTFAQLFGFPPFYGNNMDAWIDCMSSLDYPEEGRAQPLLQPNERIDLIIANSAIGHQRVPELFGSMIECTCLVNQRYIASGSHTRVRLILE